ncbi:MAG: pyrroline-5-carboxylate reductase [Alphaproteobacteria bacterium]|nr:pyrroline-5-carboxylate reductase [Alphaproteobacteria bacterium]
MASRILLVGCGKMGGALLAGWLDRGIDPAGIVVVEPSPDAAAAIAATLPKGAALPRFVAAAEAVPDDFAPDLVMLAVKPQEAARALPAHARHAAGGACFLSIMAGRTIGGMQALLGPGAAIVRAMPNTPAAVRKGVTVCCAGQGVNPAQRTLCDQLLGAVGEVAWVEEEGHMDAVTAVSGSGPAYVFLLAEAMEEAGKAQGLPPALARQLARATVAGAGALLGASAEEAATLRRNVTSPGGTTAAALGVLMAEGAVPALMGAAIAAATKRSRELAG